MCINRTSNQPIIIVSSISGAVEFRIPEIGGTVDCVELYCKTYVEARLLGGICLEEKCPNHDVTACSTYTNLLFYHAYRLNLNAHTFSVVYPHSLPIPLLAGILIKQGEVHTCRCGRIG